jgi:hypothetical protein
MKQSQEEQLVITQREFFQGLEAQRLHEAQQLREAQQVYNAQLLDHTAKVNQARLTQEAAHRRKRDAFDAFEQAQSPAKLARIQGDTVVATTARPEQVAEAEAVVPVVDAAEAVVEAPEAVVVSVVEAPGTETMLPTDNSESDSDLIWKHFDDTFDTLQAQQNAARKILLEQIVARVDGRKALKTFHHLMYTAHIVYTQKCAQFDAMK